MRKYIIPRDKSNRWARAFWKKKILNSTDAAEEDMNLWRDVYHVHG